MDKERSQRERDALFKLHQINRAMSTERDMEKLLRLILDSAVALTRAERGFMILGQEENYEVRVARNIGKHSIDHPEFKVSRGIIESTWRTSSPVILDDAKSDGQFRENESVTQLRLASVMAIPLKRHDGIVGVLYLDNPNRKGLFQAADLLILQIFCDEAAIAVENARLLQEIDGQRQQLDRLVVQLQKANQGLKKDKKKLQEELDRLGESLGTPTPPVL